MADTGARYAGTAANFNDGGTTAWSSPTNAEGDTTGTSTTCAPSSSGATSQRLRASSYGFEVPTDATIDGVLVEYERDGSNNNRFTDNSVRLLVGGTEAGDDLTPATNWNNKVIQEVGGADVLWGLELTPAIVNAAGFGVSIKGQRTASQTVTGRLYRVALTVFYTEASTEPDIRDAIISGGGGGDASPVADTDRLLTDSASGGGDAAIAAETTRDVALAGSGGGDHTAAAETDRATDLQGAGGGDAAWSYEIGGQDVRDATITATGGGDATIASETSRDTALTGTGGGDGQVTVGTTRDAVLVALGGGAADEQHETVRDVAVIATGGGSAAWIAEQPQSGLVNVILTGTGGGDGMLSGETDRHALLIDSGGDGGGVEALTVRFVVLLGSGDGDGQVSAEQVEQPSPGGALSGEPPEVTITGSGGGSGNVSQETVREVVLTGSGGGDADMVNITPVEYVAVFIHPHSGQLVRVRKKRASC